MILMALDHVRDYLHASAFEFRPEDLTRATAALFLTRWVTHFCAPVFAFAAGLGAFLWLRPGRTRPQLARFLLTRGLWLVVLDLTAIQLAFWVLFPPGTIVLTVLWVLGLSMVILAGLIFLPRPVLLGVSLLILAGHNLLDGVAALAPIHQQFAFSLAGKTIVLGYPILPWFAVMAAGYCAGPLLDRRRRFFWGLALTLAFLLVRAANVYGDPAPWTRDLLPLSFLNCTKYPPSLLFLLMTLGPALVFWAWAEGRSFSESHPLVVFGRTPLFYFLVHLFLIEALSLAGRVTSLWAVYALWALVVALLYPLCRWFAALRRRSSNPWLSYL